MTISSADEQVADVAAAAAALHADLAAESAWQLGEDALLRVTGSLARLRSSVDAAYLRAVAEVERRRSAGPLDGGTDGPRGAGGLRGAGGIGSSTESFLRTSAPLTPGQARSDVAAARALGPDGPLHDLEPGLACGDITRAHVDVGVRCLDRIPVHLRTAEADRATLAAAVVRLAPTRHAQALRHDANQVLAELAPDVADRFDPRSYERRFLDMTTDLTGMLVGSFALDPVAGATFAAAVDAASAPRPDADGVRDDRSARERRADAMVVMAETSTAVRGPLRGERPRVVVHTTAVQLADMLAAGTARTDTGTRLGPQSVRQVSCDAVLQRVVWDRDGTLLGSVPLDLGRAHRLATPDLRRALAARDRGCIIPGCHARPAHCDAHHVVHWTDGGPTTLTNTTLLCGSHHTAVHHGTWQVRMGPDGIPEAVPPERIDPLRRPRRAPHHDLDEVLEALRPRADDGAPTCAARDSWLPPGWDPAEPYPF